MMNHNFAVLILTHGRPDNIKTIPTLRKHGYTGKIYLIIDHLDNTKDKYIQNFGDDVFIFDKYKAAEITDTGDNFQNMKAVVYARNYAWNIAKQLKLDYFLVLDDDYGSFQYRFNDKKEYQYKPIKNLDVICSKFVNYLKSTNFLTLCFAQTGDFFGGGEGMFGKKIFMRRKAMNAFFCATDRPFEFFGSINEDCTAYVRLGETGKLFGTLNQICLQQTATQQNEGGLTDIYLSLGTYVKSFYSVIWSPSCVKCAMLRSTNSRIHHSIEWKSATPMILRESTRK